MSEPWAQSSTGGGRKEGMCLTSLQIQSLTITSVQTEPTKTMGLLACPTAVDTGSYWVTRASAPLLRNAAGLQLVSHLLRSFFVVVAATRQLV